MLTSMIVMVVNIIQDPLSSSAEGDMKLIRAVLNRTSKRNTTWRQDAPHIIARDALAVAEKAVLKRRVPHSEVDSSKFEQHANTGICPVLGSNEQRTLNSSYTYSTQPSNLEFTTPTAGITDRGSLQNAMSNVDWMFDLWQTPLAFSTEDWGDFFKAAVNDNADD